MKFKKKEIDDDQLDFAEFIKILWNDKILILIICLIFTISFYLYRASESDIIKKNITLKDAEESLFHEIRKIKINFILSNHDIIELNKIFKTNLMSLDKLILFTENNNEIEDFKSHLKKKNISFEEYFHNKINIETSKLDYELKYANTYDVSFVYSNPLEGEKFLYDYILFINEISKEIYKKKLFDILSRDIKVIKKNLEISNKIQQEYPVPSGEYANQPFYLQGTIVLYEKLYNLEKNLEDIQNISINYNPFLQTSIPPRIISRSSIFYTIIGLVVGIFFSFIIICLKFIIKKY